MLLSVDPSINEVGIALLEPDGDYHSSFCLRSEKDSRNSFEKVRSVSSGFLDFLSSLKEAPEEIVIEHTRFFARAKNTSHASAQKLNLVKGALYGLAMARLGCRVSLVWIPGFSKQSADLLARSKKLPKITQHERDAFWLGNTWLGLREEQRKQFLYDPKF